MTKQLYIDDCSVVFGKIVSQIGFSCVSIANDTCKSLQRYIFGGAISAELNTFSESMHFFLNIYVFLD